MLSENLLFFFFKHTTTSNRLLSDDTANTLRQCECVETSILSTPSLSSFAAADHVVVVPNYSRNSAVVTADCKRRTDKRQKIYLTICVCLYATISGGKIKRNHCYQCHQTTTR